MVRPARRRVVELLLQVLQNLDWLRQFLLRTADLANKPGPGGSRDHEHGVVTILRIVVVSRA